MGGIAALGLAAVVLLGIDCYKPSVESGGLRCATGAKACPDGFTCTGDFCVSSSEVPDGSVGTGGHGGASGGHVGSGGQLGSGGLPGTGGVSGTGGITGGGGNMSDVPRAVGETCTITDLDAADQSDNCVTGAVCAQDCAQNICFPTCSTDDDCPTSSCTRVTMSGTKICELAYMACDPHAQPGQQGCGGSTYCYLLSSASAPSGGSRTVCDCNTGEGMVGSACMDSRDCFPGLVCPVATAPGGGFCRQACDPSGLLTTTGCSSLTSGCHAYGPKWGYCY